MHGLTPAAVYPPGLSLAPHPGAPYFDALPVSDMIRIRRRDLPDLVASGQSRSPRNTRMRAREGEFHRPSSPVTLP